MSMQVTIKNTLIRGRGVHELEKDVWEGLIIRDYLNARISLGELAELMGLELMAARDWLSAQGVPTIRKFPVPEHTPQESWYHLSLRMNMSDVSPTKKKLPRVSPENKKRIFNLLQQEGGTEEFSEEWIEMIHESRV